MFIICLLLISLIYIYLTWTFNYWKKKGVKYLRPTIFIGNMLDAFAFRTSVGELFAKMYDACDDSDFIGIWVFRKPALVVKNPEIIKSILVKDFQHFYDRTTHADGENDPLGCNNLFMIKNPQWKSMRVKLSPTFTSGKMRATLSLIDKAGRDMTEYIDHQIDRENDSVFEMKELCSKFTTDSIASFAYGVEADSFKDPDALFRNLGRKIFDFDYMRGLELSTFFFAPDIAKFFKFKMFSSKCTNILRKVFWDVIQKREVNRLERNDLIDTLIQLKNEKVENKNEIRFVGDTLLAQATVFFTAGFETTSTTISLTIYELTLQPDLQKRLYHDIETVLKKYDGKITYESVQDMNYLDMCIKETLRKYPPLPFLDRYCTRNYKITGKYNVDLEPGNYIYIPILGMQMDPDNFPEPTLYDPERFSPENIKKIKPFTYMPFGEGPRNCIGAKFGMLQSKIGLIYMIRNYEMIKCKTTPAKMTFNPRSLLLTSLRPLDICLKNRYPKQ